MSGVEAAIHAVRTVHTDDSSEGLLLVDARDAFNSLILNVLVRNFSYIIVLVIVIVRLVNTFSFGSL